MLLNTANFFKADRTARGLSLRGYAATVLGTSHVAARNLELGRVSVRFLRRLARTQPALAKRASAALVADILSGDEEQSDGR